MTIFQGQVKASQDLSEASEGLSQASEGLSQASEGLLHQRRNPKS